MKVSIKSTTSCDSLYVCCSLCKLTFTVVTVWLLKPGHLEEDYPITTLKMKDSESFLQTDQQYSSFNYATVENFKTVWTYLKSQEIYEYYIGPFAKNMRILFNWIIATDCILHLSKSLSSTDYMSFLVLHLQLLRKFVICWAFLWLSSRRQCSGPEWRLAVIMYRKLRQNHRYALISTVTNEASSLWLNLAKLWWVSCQIAADWQTYSAGNYRQTSNIVQSKFWKCPSNIAICLDIIINEQLIDVATVLVTCLSPQVDFKNI